MSLTYKLVYDADVIKFLKKMDKLPARRIAKWLDERLTDCKNPRLWGSALSGGLGEFWRYRIGDYRVICKIADKELKVFLIKLGHRRDIYLE